ncbi:hypothetical protein HNR21_006892 [Actinomadura cellulosilytica]|uniref:Uncharacterized protein n=1 Tax=Thermomonospora cellulosilytica TaxID=1411118 RepID=A0A7W3RD69_9ACTN|nr:hypothetical protein [Thermomonospora cellulosilytica]
MGPPKRERGLLVLNDGPYPLIEDGRHGALG